MKGSRVGKNPSEKSVGLGLSNDDESVYTRGSLDMGDGSEKIGKAPSEGSVSTHQGDEKSQKFRGSRRNSLRSDSGSASFSEK
jgi:hypothetical protein